MKVHRDYYEKSLSSINNLLCSIKKLLRSMKKRLRSMKVHSSYLQKAKEPVQK